MLPKTLTSEKYPWDSPGTTLTFYCPQRVFQFSTIFKTAFRFQQFSKTVFHLPQIIFQVFRDRDLKMQLSGFRHTSNSLFHFSAEITFFLAFRHLLVSLPSSLFKDSPSRGLKLWGLWSALDCWVSLIQFNIISLGPTLWLTFPPLPLRSNLFFVKWAALRKKVPNVKNCQKKNFLKKFEKVGVIPKEGWTGYPSILLFVWQRLRT